MANIQDIIFNPFLHNSFNIKIQVTNSKALTKNQNLFAFLITKYNKVKKVTNV